MLETGRKGRPKKREKGDMKGDMKVFENKNLKLIEKKIKLDFQGLS